MKTLGKAVIGGALLLTMFAPAGRADGTSSKNAVSWETIIGTFFIPATPPATGSSNTVGGIIGGGFPWSTLGGRADVNLSTGAVDFKVKGLVLAAGKSIGTPGTLTDVLGALVCNPGAATPMIFYTSAVPLDGQGNASFRGSFGPLPIVCTPSALAFLITTTATPPHWIANGAVQVPFP
jgi:hypothetical protein